MNINNLLKYYTECLEIESYEEHSLPLSQLNKKFIEFNLQNEWSK
jgi:hypothetical protein